MARAVARRRRAHRRRNPRPSRRPVSTTWTTTSRSSERRICNALKTDVRPRAWGVPVALPAATMGAPVLAQSKKDTAVIGMTLEPPGLDPTAGAASAIGEVVQYNVLETLTKIESDGSIAPLLAQ